MGHSLIFWTVSLLAQSGEGQIVETESPSCGCQVAQAAQPPLGTGFYDRQRLSGSSETAFQQSDTYPPTGDVSPSQPDRPGFFARLKDRMSNLFGRPSSQQTGPIDLGTPIVEPSRDLAYTPLMIRGATTSEPPLANPPADNKNKVVQVGFASNDPPPASVSAIPPPNALPAIPSPAVEGPANTGVILPKFVNKIGHEEDFSWVTGQLGQANGQWVIHYATPDTVDNFGGKLVLVGNMDMSSYHVGDLISVQGGLTSQRGRVIGAYQVHNISLIER